MLQVNYPIPLTDLHQKQQVLRTLQFMYVYKQLLILLLPCSLRKWKYGDGKKKSCSRLLQILIVLHSKHEKKSFFESACVCVCAVSYTHLDVYKRQSMTLPKRLVLQKTLVYGQTGREGILTKKYFFLANNVVHI